MIIDFLVQITPFLASGVGAASLFLIVLQTTWGSRAFDAAFKYAFDRRLANLRHDHDVKLAGLRHNYDTSIESIRMELSYLSDRDKRSNELEYQALIETWDAFVTAFDATRACVARIMSYPDLDRMSEDGIDEFLNITKLSDREKSLVKNTTNKNASFSKIKRGRLIDDANSAISIYRSVAMRKGIFIPPEIEADLATALEHLQSCWAEQYVHFEHPGDIKLEKSISLMGKAGDELRSSIRDTLRMRVLRIKSLGTNDRSGL